MKRVCVFSLFAGLMIGESFGVCTYESGFESADEYLNISKSNINYECDSWVCGNGYRLSVLDGAWASGRGSYDGPGRWKCVLAGGDDYWVPDGDIKSCTSLPTTGDVADYIIQPDSNAKAQFYDYSAKKLIEGNVVGNNNDLCVVYKCDKNFGYFPSVDRTKCVKSCLYNGVATAPGKNKEGLSSCFKESVAKLPNTKNVKDGDFCQLYCDDKGNWFLKVTDQACISGYVANDDGTQCVKSKATKKKEKDAADKKRRDEESKKQAELDQKKCEDSFGEWKDGRCVCDSAKNLTQNTQMDCKCIDETKYEKNAAAKRCDLTSSEKLKQLCDSPSVISAGGYWNGTACLCQEDERGRPREFNAQAGTCVLPREIVNCDKVQGAQWSVAKKECVCLTKDYIVDPENGKCIEDPEVVKQRETAKLKKKIKVEYEALGALSNLKKSVWRDAEGEFNTARLASDSIAGVVLGTTGALVTSHLVKKKQVEDGFEAISCTIGGQTVAGWGDEFSIGQSR